MHDDQLREQFTGWARPLQAARPPALPVIRRRARRRTARRAAVSGLAVMGAVAAIALSGFPRIGHAPVPAIRGRGVPPYAVVLDNGGATVSAVDMVTGQVLGKVAAPVAGSDFQWAAAAGDDRTFVLADQSQTLTDRFYLLRLAAGGQPVRLAPLNVPPLHDAQIYGLAVTADASTLAVAWQNYPAAPGRSHIDVTTLATGATRAWTSASGSALALSWAGQHTLAFEWQDNTSSARSGLRLLDTAATTTATTPLASRLLIPASTRAGLLNSPGDPLISQDGSTIFATMASGAKTSVVSFSARTGRLEAVLTRPAATGQSPWYCGVLWAGPHGRYLLTQCGATEASIDHGHYTRIHLRRLIPASPIGYANTFAW
jgi:hypothetical protein